MVQLEEEEAGWLEGNIQLVAAAAGEGGGPGRLGNRSLAAGRAWSGGAVAGGRMAGGRRRRGVEPRVLLLLVSGAVGPWSGQRG